MVALSAIGGLILSACSVFGEPGSIERPSYAVTRSDGVIEVRAYPPLLLASTTVAGDYDRMTDIAFNRLFKYISGANDGGRKIAMTSPVVMNPETEGRKIAMTAPVISTPDSEGGWTMSFLVPSQYTLETVPRPTDPSVRIVAMPARQAAAITFSGFLNRQSIDENRRKLQEWLTAGGFGFDPALYEAAGYNPPWTLPPLRRNEVLIPIQ